ncbi:MAG: TonB-dependent receptor [Burkholderiales bacterium]
MSYQSVKSFLSLGVASASIIAATPALAQGAFEGPATGDTEIVVTARRTEERLLDVPISITVFNQQQISNRNITTASDLGTYTPSLTANSRFGSDKSTFAIRGFSQDGTTSPTVGVYFADVVALRSAAGVASGNGAGVGAFFDLQNVQVLKGPQGTLFGRNTTGGAIMLVPKKPTARFEGYIEGSIGNYDLRRVQAVINVPLADTVRMRLGVDRQTRDGYLHNRSGIGPKDFANVDYTSIRASVVTDLTPDLENYLIARYSRSDTHGPMFRVSECQRNPALRIGRIALLAPSACAQVDRQAARGDGFYDVENVVPNPFDLTKEWQVSNTTTWNASDPLTIKNIVSYGQIRERFHLSIGGENFAVQSGPNAGAPFPGVIIRNIQGQYGTIQSTFTEELQFQGRTPNGKLTWQAGGYLEISDPMKGGNTSNTESNVTCTDAYTYTCRANSPLAALAPVFTKVAFRNIGFYGQGSYKITNKLAVTAGLRYTIDRIVASGGRATIFFPQPNTPVGRCANPLVNPGLSTLDPVACPSGEFIQKSKRPTWLIDLEYKPITDVMLYAKYSRGYRQGGADSSVVGLETWKPETVDSYEVGAKGKFDGRVSGYFSVSAFYNDFSNQQLIANAVAKPTSGLPGTRVVLNAGTSRIWGIEVDASITPFEGFRLDGGYAYLNTKLTKFDATVLPTASPYQQVLLPRVGGELPLSPRHRLTATATYTLPLDQSIGRISFAATYTYTYKQLSNASTPFGVLPSSNLLNLNANWDSVAGLPIDLAAFVTNVTKKQFPVSVGGNFTSSGYESFVPNQPRMFGLRLKYRLGAD